MLIVIDDVVFGEICVWINVELVGWLFIEVVIWLCLFFDKLLFDDCELVCLVVGVL